MSAKVQPKRPNYSVKDIETVAAGKDVRVRLFTLAPGEVIPWHSHSKIADDFFVLEGELTVESRSPDDQRTLCVGERHRISPQQPHQTSNRGTKDCQFLLVQGVGSMTSKTLRPPGPCPAPKSVLQDLPSTGIARMRKFRPTNHPYHGQVIEQVIVV